MVVSPGAPFTESSVYQEGYEPPRVIILLTDGENTAFPGDSYNSALSGNSMYGHSDGSPTADVTMYDGATDTVTQMDKRLIEIADNIKKVKRDDGQPMFEIYTILFAADSSTEMKRIMKEIATEPNSPYYYNAPTQSELDAAFNEIGNHLSNLRLSK